MKYIVDSIEDGVAKLEADDLTHKYIPESDLPFGACEGSVLLFDDEGIKIMTDEETKRRKRILELQNKLRNKNRK